MRQVGMAMTQRMTQGRTMMLDGSHLFPMEQPLATAAAIEASLLNLQAVTQAAERRAPLPHPVAGGEATSPGGYLTHPSTPW